jgi:hypothetical protein
MCVHVAFSPTFFVSMSQQLIVDLGSICNRYICSLCFLSHFIVDTTNGLLQSIEDISGKEPSCDLGSKFHFANSQWNQTYERKKRVLSTHI